GWFSTRRARWSPACRSPGSGRTWARHRCSRRSRPRSSTCARSACSSVPTPTRNGGFSPRTTSGRNPPGGIAATTAPRSPARALRSGDRSAVQRRGAPRGYGAVADLGCGVVPDARDPRRALRSAHARDRRADEDDRAARKRRGVSGHRTRADADARRPDRRRPRLPAARLAARARPRALRRWQARGGVLPIEARELLVEPGKLLLERVRIGEERLARHREELRRVLGGVRIEQRLDAALDHPVEAGVGRLERARPRARVHVAVGLRIPVRLAR